MKIFYIYTNNKMKKILFYFFVAVSFIACTNKSTNSSDTQTNATAKNDEIKTGGAKLIQVDGKYNVWTKKIGLLDLIQVV